MTNKGNLYTAESGKVIIRKSDNFVMGESICLGISDSIDNYTERPYTKLELESLVNKNSDKIENFLEEIDD